MIGRERREVEMTLLCGKLANLESHPGPVRGERAGQAGTSSAQSWPGEWDSGGSCSRFTPSFPPLFSDILGEMADIHTGGVDLKFPHHDNEIAQAEVRGQQYVSFIFVLSYSFSVSFLSSIFFPPFPLSLHPFLRSGTVWL